MDAHTPNGDFIIKVTFANNFFLDQKSIPKTFLVKYTNQSHSNKTIAIIKNIFINTSLSCILVENN